MSDVSAAPKRRVPTWIKVALAVFAVLFVLGAVFGKPAGDKAVAQAPPTTIITTTTAPTSSSAPAIPVYRVTGVNGDVVVLSDTAGISKTIYVPGIQPAADCYGTETASWAANFLTGKEVTLQAVTEQAGKTLAHVVLGDGTDYAIAALQGGYARFAAGAVADSYANSLRAAETAASATKTGLWGPPCNGSPTMPPVAPPPAPAAPPPATTKPAAPKPTTAEPTEEPDSTSAYYPNCAAARAAGAAPLHRGEPGYRSGLDRDGDGTACE